MEARALINNAPSLIKHLDADSLALVAWHVEQGLVAGRWTKTIKTQRIRDDGHLERSLQTITLWLRPNFEAQYASRQTWISYRGKTVRSGQFGGGSSTETIEQLADRRPVANHEAFLWSNSQPAAGRWAVTGTGEAATLTLWGSGHFSAGAVEDDDLLCSGGGPKARVSFSVLVSDLRADFQHTPAPRETAAALGESMSSWKRDWHTPPWLRSLAPKRASQCVVM